MKHFHPTLLKTLPLMVLASLLQTFEMRAAEKPAPVAPKEISDAAVHAAWQRRIAEYSSDSLPLGEVVTFLQNQFPEINFHLKAQHGGNNSEPANLFGVEVRINRLRNATLAELLQVIELAADRPIQITGRAGDRLVVFDSKAAGSPENKTLVTRVFSLAKYLENRSPDEEAKALAVLQEVLAEAGDMYAAANRSTRFDPRLNIHRGTKLLIVVGRTDELALVEQIVRELQNPGGVRSVTSTEHHDSGPARTSAGQATGAKF